jgi:methionyl-tRNA formyltransferase
MKEIISTNPKTTDQEGIPVYFKRRTPEESEILQIENLQSLFDFIRMLDADGYPRAFIDYEGYRLEFSNASISNGCIHADVKIIQTPKDMK